MRTSFHIPFPAAGAMRLAVFHHAGGSGLSFLKLAKQLSSRVEVVLAELPGRGRRHRETEVASLAAFASEAAAELADMEPRPLTLYGHSMGALVAYEIAKTLGPRVERLVVSSCRCPASRHGPDGLRLNAPLSDELLLTLMAEYGPLPKELSFPGAREYFLPLFRADLKLISQYAGVREPVSPPILAMGGGTDPVVSEADLREWAAYTQGGFELRMLEGGHFFVLEDSSILEKAF
jgi:pyochelin biosynthesis protein PchC